MNEINNECGKILGAREGIPLAINGNDTTITKHPWFAALYDTNGSNFSFFCGASLITKKLIITGLFLYRF
jgi:secreted trypsin-like serine protease